MTPSDIAKKTRKVIETNKGGVVKDVYFNPLFAPKLKIKVPELKEAKLFITVTETESERGTVKVASIKSMRSGDTLKLGSTRLDGESVYHAKLVTLDQLIEFIESDLMEFSPVPVPANPAALSDGFCKGFQEQLGITLRNGFFTSKDVDTLKRYPLFPETVLDAFVKELGNATKIVVEKVPVPAPAGPVVLNMNMNTKEVCELAATIATFNGLIEEMKSSVDVLTKAVLSLPIPAATPSGDQPMKSAHGLYDECLRIN